MKKAGLKLCAVLALAALAAAQAPGREITARIIDGLTGQPIPRVRFTLTGGGLLDGLTGTSESEDSVVLSSVRPGTYRLTLEKAGYFPEPYELIVTDSSPATLGEIVMTAKREISGTVRWQDGEPSARAQVRVIGIRGGKIVPRPDLQTIQTNDRGEFVIGNLRPGRYILVAAPPTFTGGIDPSGQVAQGGVPRLAFPVFFPGVNVADARATIDLRGTLNVPNVSIIFEEKPGVVVEGTVVPSSTAPMGTNVTISIGNQGLFTASTQGRAGDTFRIGPIPAGFYVLDASSQGAQPGRLLIPLTIGGTTFRGMAVSIPPPTFLAGQVEIDDPAIRPTANIAIQSEKIPGTMAGTAGPTGEFRIARTVAGETYSMSVDPRSLPPNSYIASVSQGVQQLTTSPFQVAAGGDPVRLVLKTDGGTIEGVVKDAGRPVASAFVVLAPANRRREQDYRTAIAGSAGAFKLSAIAPGNYDLFAFDRNEDDDYLDERFLQEFASRNVQATVSAKSSGSVDLAVIRLPRR
jgi:hypothetical protein